MWQQHFCETTNTTKLLNFIMCVFKKNSTAMLTADILHKDKYSVTVCCLYKRAEQPM